MNASLIGSTNESSAQTDIDIEAALFQIFSKYIKQKKLDWNTKITMEEAEIDSLDLVEIVFEIEDQFGTEINFNANTKPIGQTTFSDVADLIRSALAAKARAA